MPTNKKPRKRYKPKPVLVDPLGYAIEGVSPIESADITDIALKNSSAMSALLRGHATKKDMDVLIAMSNITEALVRMGFGADCVEVAVAGREAILAIVWRAVRLLKFLPKGEEIKALNALLELHDAQFAVITVSELEAAVKRAKAHIKSGNCSKLPVPVFPTESKP